MFSNRPRIRNPVTNTAKFKKPTAKNPYFGIPAPRNAEMTMTAPMIAVMMTDCISAPSSSSNHRTPIWRGRPGIIQNNRNSTPTRTSTMKPTMAITPNNTNASSITQSGSTTNNMKITAPSRPNDCPRTQSH